MPVVHTGFSVPHHAPTLGHRQGDYAAHTHPTDPEHWACCGRSCCTLYAYSGTRQLLGGCSWSVAHSHEASIWQSWIGAAGPCCVTPRTCRCPCRSPRNRGCGSECSAAPPGFTPAAAPHSRLGACNGSGQWRQAAHLHGQHQLLRKRQQREAKSVRSPA